MYIATSFVQCEVSRDKFDIGRLRHLAASVLMEMGFFERDEGKAVLNGYYWIPNHWTLGFNCIFSCIIVMNFRFDTAVNYLGVQVAVSHGDIGTYLGWHVDKDRCQRFIIIFYLFIFFFKERHSGVNFPAKRKTVKFRGIRRKKAEFHYSDNCKKNVIFKNYSKKNWQNLRSRII